MPTRRKAIAIICIVIALLITISLLYIYTRSAGGSAGGSKRSAKYTTVIRIGGATAPMYQIEMWIKILEKKYPNITVMYDAVGSGKGIAGFLNGIYDIALHDPPMPSEQWEKAYRMYGPLLECPDVGGAVVITYNIPGFKGALNLTGRLIAYIFIGKIRNWCSDAILKYNPGLVKICKEHHYSIRIIPVVRREASGTTFIFVTYLTLASKLFKEIMKIEYSKRGPMAYFRPDWASIWKEYAHSIAYGTYASGNYGIATVVKRTPGAIGYVEWSYAIFNNLSMARILNRDGYFVYPSYRNVVEAFKNAAKILEKENFNPLSDLWKERTYEKILNPPGRYSYPIIFFSHLTVKLRYRNVAKAIAIYRFLSIVWSLNNTYIKGYIPVPKDMRLLCLNTLIKNMVINGKPLTKYVNVRVIQNTAGNIG